MVGTENVNMGGALLNDIRSMYVNSLTCVRLKSCESESFKIDRGGRRECVVAPWVIDMYMNRVMKKTEDGAMRMRVRF